jgi:ABC-type nitrate/sulfonate/bicarbonate transport system permease component
MKRYTDYLPAAALVVVIVLAWQAYTASGLVSSAILPTPTSIMSTLVSNRSVLWGHSLQTLSETLIGLIIAVLLGVGFAITLFLSAKLRKALYPLLVISQTVPIIALAPLLLIWFGFDLVPKVIVVVLYCFYPISISVLGGIRGADDHLVDLMKSLRASRLQTLRYVQLPAALPAFFSGLKIATTYAITGAVVGEYVGAYKGLGIYMETAAHADAINAVFAAIFVIVGLSLLLLGLVMLIEKWAIPWKDVHG